MHPSPLAGQLLDRRTFIADLGRGALALAIFSLTGCGPGGVATPSLTGPERTPGPEPTAGQPTGGGPGPTATPVAGATDGPPAKGAIWRRVNLGFVSAYLLVQGGEVALVDTGVAGSADAIEASLGELTIDWVAVRHVILTHHHADHVGSTDEVLRRAADATAYAGAADIPSISAGPLTAVADGDEIMGLRIVASPGHTAGSISVFDPLAGTLVAGDALRTEGGRPTLPGAQFTADMDLARQSVVKLGSLTFETLLVGHGEPIVGGASAMVAELGATG